MTRNDRTRRGTFRRSNPLALAVLSCLVERPMHPYEIGATLRERAKHESIRLNYGSLYGVVESLVRAGLVEPAQTEREGRRPERTIYRVTAPGRVEHADWLADLLATPAKEFTQFEAGLSLMGGLAPQDVVRLLEMRALALQREVNALEADGAIAREQGLPRLFVVEHEYRHALRRAELEFTRRLAGEIADGSLDGVDLWRSLHEELARAEAEGRPPVYPEFTFPMPEQGASDPKETG